MNFRFLFSSDNSEEYAQAIDEKEMKSILNSDFLRNCLSRSQVITIALEPFYCGGEEECKKILKTLSLNLREPLGIDIEQSTLEAFGEDIDYRE